MNKRQKKKHNKKFMQKSHQSYLSKMEMLTYLFDKMETAPDNIKYAIGELLKAFAYNNLPISQSEDFLNSKLDEFNRFNLTSDVFR